MASNEERIENTNKKRKRHDLTLQRKREILEAWKRSGNASETARNHGISRRLLYKIKAQEKTINEAVAQSPSNSNRKRITTSMKCESERRREQTLPLSEANKEAVRRSVEPNGSKIRRIEHTRQITESHGSQVEVKPKLSEGSEDSELQGKNQ